MSKIKVEKLVQFSGHNNAVYTLTRGTEDNTFISSSGDGVVAQWDLEQQTDPKALASVNTQVFSVLFILNYNLLIIGQMQGGIHIIDVAKNKEIKFITTHSGSIFDLKWDEKTDRLLAISGDGYISAWTLPAVELFHKKKLSGQNLRTLTFHPTRDVLAVGCSSNYIHLLRSDNYEVLHQFEAHENSVFSLCYTADGKYLFSGSRDAHLKVWNVEKNYELWHAIPAHRFTVNDLCLILNGKYIASAGRDNEIRIWDVETFELLKVLNQEKNEGHSHSVNKLLWMEEQQLLLSTSDDKLVMAWHIFEH